MTSTPAERDTLPPGSIPLLAILALGAFVMILNETIMSVALETLMGYFDITAATAQWLTTAFMLTMAVVIPTTGWILTRFHIRTVFIAANLLFLIGTTLAALAPTFGVLVAARVTQAAGTAIMMPLMMTTAITIVPAQMRGRVMGVVSIVISVAPAVGPTVGGLILHYLTWRWMFYTVLPIGVIVLLLGLFALKNATTPQKIPLDIFSVILSAIGFSGVIYGLSSIGEAAQGTAAMPPWIPLVIGVIALIIFAIRQVSLNDFALLNLRVFSHRTFTMSAITILITMTCMFGVIVVLPIYMQRILGLLPDETGMIMLPGGLVMAVLGWLVGQLFDKFGARPLLVPGSIITVAALWMMSTFSADTPVWFIITAHIIQSFGMGFMMGPLMTSALNSLPRRLYSHGSATLSTLQQVAGAAGTALYITVMTVGTRLGVEAGQSEVEASMTGIHNAFLIGASLSLIVLVLVWFVRNPKPEPAATQNVEE